MPGFQLRFACLTCYLWRWHRSHHSPVVVSSTQADSANLTKFCQIIHAAGAPCSLIWMSKREVSDQN
ncbi:unnamed protein product [Calypogeia fissa]